MLANVFGGVGGPPRTLVEPGMATNKRRLVWIGIISAGLCSAIAAPAFAEGKGGKEGCGKRAQARFEEADKNDDGALTKAEVGDKKWERIKVADANSDGKVTLAEMKQAKADGKLKHRKGKKKEAAA